MTVHRACGWVLVSVLVADAGAAASAAPAPESESAPGLATVTWQQALDRAFERNASAIVAAQEIERASALVREARAGWLPTLTGNGSYSRLDSARMFGGNVTTPIGQWNGNLAL